MGSSIINPQCMAAKTALVFWWSLVMFSATKTWTVAKDAHLILLHPEGSSCFTV